jgi:hypothetical protein
MCVEELCVEERCVKKKCVREMCVKELCVKERNRAEAEAGRRPGGIQNQKPEPQTKMWGKIWEDAERP